MKNILFITLFGLVGCNGLQRLTGSVTESPQSVQAPSNMVVTGQTNSDNDYVPVRTNLSDLVVKVLRPTETEWVTINKYEFQAFSNNQIRFGHKVKILPNGNITFRIPEEPVAPIGTRYEIATMLKE